MKNKYSDSELLNALKNWQEQIGSKLKNEKYKKNIHDSNLIKNILKPIKKEIKKQSKNTHTDWNNIWREVVQEEIITFTKVKRWHNGFLEVIVDNPALRSELDAFYKDSLIESIKSLVDDKKVIRGIKFISN